MRSLTTFIFRSFLDRVRILNMHVLMWVRVSNFIPDLSDFLPGGAAVSWFARGGAIANVTCTTAA